MSDEQRQAKTAIASPGMASIMAVMNRRKTRGLS